MCTSHPSGKEMSREESGTKERGEKWEREVVPSMLYAQSTSYTFVKMAYLWTNHGCQFDWIWNQLKFKPLSSPVGNFLDQIISSRKTHTNLGLLAQPRLRCMEVLLVACLSSLLLTNSSTLLLLHSSASIRSILFSSKVDWSSATLQESSRFSIRPEMWRHPAS